MTLTYFFSGFAELICIRCGKDGICKPGFEEEEVKCNETMKEKSCILTTILENNTFIEYKNCFPGDVAARGCVSITGREVMY